MAKVPKGISVQRLRNSVTLTTSNYSDSLYLMQVMMFIPFLSIVSILYLIYSPFGLLFTLPLLLATIRWTYHNKMDHYKIYLNPKRLIITKGMSKRKLINTDLHRIEDVFIVKITRPTLGEFPNDPILDNRNELIVKTKFERVVVTNSLIDSEQIFIKNTILKWRNQHIKIIPIDDDAAPQDYREDSLFLE